MERVKKITSGMAFRMIAGIVSGMIFFNIVVILIGYDQFTESLTREYNDAAFRTAETAKTYFDGNKIDEYLESGGNTPEYQEIWNKLNTLCQKQNVTLIYVIDVDQSDYNSFRSVFNTVNDNSGFTPWEVGYHRQTTNEEYRQIYIDLYENGGERGTIFRTTGLNGSNPHITSLIPVKADDGTVEAILCVERPMEELEIGRVRYMKNIIMTALLATVVASCFMGFFLRRNFMIPAEKIITEAKRFAAENTKVEGRDLGTISKITEIRELGESLEKMETDTITYMENLTKATAEKQRISTELSLATRIQANMLPNQFPAFPGRTEFDIYASMDPAKEVGGDFYDFFLIDEDHLGIVVADVAGKGIPAALFMMMSKMLVHNYAQEGVSPAAVLGKVNNTICKNNKEDMFVTVWFGIMEISTGKVKASNAGHEYPVIKGESGRFELFKRKHGCAIGWIEGVKYEDYEFVLNPGDALFLYTDGVPEATNGKMKMFTMDALVDVLNEVPEETPENLLNHVKEAVNQFVGDAPQFDDLTVMAIKKL